MRKIGAAVAIIALQGALLWIAGEMHYRNCVEAAKAYPDLRTDVERDLDEVYRELEQERGRPPRKTPLALRLDRCSRLPL